MGKALFTFLGGAAILAILGEGLAAGLLWSQGRLNADSVREIRLILSDPSELVEDDASSDETPPVSIDDVIKARAVRILHLEEREAEQQILATLVADSRFAILTEQDNLRAKQDQFQNEQEAIRERETSEAIEQSRAVLMKATSATAVEQLMELELDENVILIKGMPEKNIAALLEVFAGGDKDQIERGQQIFQAITRGTSADPGSVRVPEAL